MLDVLQETLKIALIHEKCLKEAREKLAPFFPLTPEIMDKFTLESIAYCDLYTTRFTKLHDILGAKIFRLIVGETGTPTEEMFLIDILNRMEKMNIISSAENWEDLREIRMKFALEYLHSDESQSENLNKLHEMAPELFQTLEKIIRIK